MILAEKIIKLRKQMGWSQEELAEQMNVSRQSVSKWESAASIPDLNKIILLTEIFGVTTDFLIKDEIEETELNEYDHEPGLIKVTLEMATQFVESKYEMTKQISKGVLICIYSVLPLIILSVLSEEKQIPLSEDMAAMLGLIYLFGSIVVAIGIFLKSSQFGNEVVKLEETPFELSYGVESVIKDKLQKNQPQLTQVLTLAISMIIMSVVPLIISGLFSESDVTQMMMLVLMFVLIGIAIFLMIPSITENNSYKLLIGDGDYAPHKKIENRRIEKFALFYWPFVTAIYIGWSLWTMGWGVTWIVWPIAGIAFPAFIGLMGIFQSEEKEG